MSQAPSPLADPIWDFDAELRRLVDRLRAMSVQQLGKASAAVHRACAELLGLSAALGDAAPTPLPRLRPNALGDQLAVIGSDLRSAAIGAADDSALSSATHVLVELRRSL